MVPLQTTSAVLSTFAIGVSFPRRQFDASRLAADVAGVVPASARLPFQLAGIPRAIASPTQASIRSSLSTHLSGRT